MKIKAVLHGLASAKTLAKDANLSGITPENLFSFMKNF